MIKRKVGVSALIVTRTALFVALAACAPQSVLIASNARAGGSGQRAAQTQADLDRLLEMAASDDGQPGLDAILKLRKQGYRPAVPILAKVLAKHIDSGRTHGFAAAQALFCIGTPEAHEVLGRHLLSERYDAAQGMKFAFFWDMKPPDRDAFIERYHLQSTSKDLAVSVTARPLEANDQQIEFTVTVKNVSPKPLRVYDPRVYLGDLLILRSADGHFAEKGSTIKHTRAYTKAEIEDPLPLLAPGASRNYQTVGRPRRVSFGPRRAPKYSDLALDCRDICHFIEEPGKFKVYAMFAARPSKAQLTKYGLEEARSRREAWSGRVVSQPIEVMINPPKDN